MPTSSAAPADALRAGLEVGGERLDLLLGRRDAVPLLGHLVVRHRVLRPDDDAQPDPAGDHREQRPSACVLPPRQYTTASAMAASVLTAKQAAAPSSARACDRARRVLRRSVLRRSVLRHRRAPGCRRPRVARRRRIGDRVPIHATIDEERAHAEEPRDESLGHGPGSPDRHAARVLGMTQVLDVRGDVVHLRVVEHVGAEHRHLPGPGAHGCAHLQRLGMRQRRRGIAIAQRATRAGRAVAGRAVGPEQLTAGRDVSVLDVRPSGAADRCRAKPRTRPARRCRRRRRPDACERAGRRDSASGIRPVDSW